LVLHGHWLHLAELFHYGTPIKAFPTKKLYVNGPNMNYGKTAGLKEDKKLLLLLQNDYDNYYMATTTTTTTNTTLLLSASRNGHTQPSGC